jgi:hypothetical protein
MFVYVYSVFVLSCADSGLAMGCTYWLNGAIELIKPMILLLVLIDLIKI